MLLLSFDQLPFRLPWTASDAIASPPRLFLSTSLNPLNSAIKSSSRSKRAFFVLSLLILRGAGFRRMRSLPPDGHSLSKFEHPRNESPTFPFLSTSSRGLFLNFDVPKGASLLRVYGHKLATASLYGICVDCDENNKMDWTVDGYNASNFGSSDTPPSCLFSIAFDGNSSHSVKLHNLYDNRFEAYGEINFSFVDYVYEEHGSRQLPSQATSVCANHLRRSGHMSVLSPRDNPPSSSTSCPPPHSGQLSGEMNVIIGLIVALITIVVAIFIISVIYALRLRNRKKLQRQNDLEDRNKNNLLLVTGKSGSQTVFSNGEAEVQPDKDTNGLQAESYIADRNITTQTTHPTSSSFAPHTQVDAVKLTPSRNMDTDTSTIASVASRHTRPWTRPPTSPPKEPVPALPTISPITAPIHHLHTTSRADDIILASWSPGSSPTQSRGQQRPYQSRPSPMEDLLRPYHVAMHNQNAQSSVERAHPHDQSSSSSLSIPGESRLPRKVRPVSKQLPTLPTEIIELSSMQPRSLASRGQYANHSLRAQSGRPAGPLSPMQTIPESSTGSSDNRPPRKRRATTTSVSQRTKSSEDIRPHTQLKTPVLRESKSSPDLEHPKILEDVRLMVATRSSTMQDHSSLPMQNTSPVAEFPRTKKGSVRSRSSRSSQLMSLSLTKNPSSDSSSPFPPENENSQSPDTTDHSLPVEITQATRMRFGRQNIREAKAVPSNDAHSRIPERRGVERPPLRQPPSYEQVVLVHQPVAPLNITSPSPLSPRKRALPKPPS